MTGRELIKILENLPEEAKDDEIFVEYLNDNFTWDELRINGVQHNSVDRTFIVSERKFR